MTSIPTDTQFFKVLCFLFVLTPLLFHNSSAQVDGSSDLFNDLAEKDSILFDQGFNECNLEATESLISEDLEFYHDVSGTQDREMFFNAIRENICSGSPQKPIRKLVDGSLEVFPLRNQGEIYGAIQKGNHDFFIKEQGSKLVKTGSAKFTHVWILEKGSWKLKRVLSYDHQSPE